MVSFACLTLVGLHGTTQTSVSAKERALFDQTVAGYLKSDSWNDNNAYGHSRFLQVPLHAAFLLNETAWQNQFASSFQRFLSQSKELTSSPQNSLQYLYVGSRFLALAALTKRRLDVSQPLFEKIAREATERWSWRCTNSFSGPFKGIKSSLDNKFLDQKFKRKYDRAITDEELFEFAIAGDLLFYERSMGKSSGYHETLVDIRDTALRTFRSRGTATSDGGWLFDVGAWDDHANYAFAAHTGLRPSLSPSKVSGASLDVSRSLHFPLFLVSLEFSYEQGRPERSEVQKIRAGMVRQFNTDVLVPPDSSFPSYRLTNFMDGSNGLFRYGQIKNASVDTGFGPYQLSGSFLFGWWSFLGDPSVSSAYLSLTGQFPLSEPILRTYMGPSFVSMGESKNSWYGSGMAELACNLGAKLPFFSAYKASPTSSTLQKGGSATIKKSPTSKKTTKRTTKRKKRS